jgi:hypothetical protein
MAVDVARHATAWDRAHKRAEQRVAAERLDHGVRVGVEIQQRSRALHRRGQVAQVIQPVARLHVPVERTQLDDATAMRQAQAAPVGAVERLLDPGDRTQREKREQSGGIQGSPVGKPQDDCTAVLGGAVAPCAGADLAWRRREDLADRGVELAHALKARGERDLDDRDAGCLEQDPRGLRALRTGERERPGTDDGDELAVDVTLAVAEAAGETDHALAVDDAVGDQPHRASDEIRAAVPLGRAGGRVRATALARAKPRRLGRGGGREEAHVLALGRTRRAARTAVDPGRLDPAEHPSVEPRILGLDGLPEALGVKHHASTIAHRPGDNWRKSDMVVQRSPISAERRM